MGGWLGGSPAFPLGDRGVRLQTLALGRGLLTVLQAVMGWGSAGLTSHCKALGGFTGVGHHLLPPSFWFQSLPSPGEAEVPAPWLRKSRERGHGGRVLGRGRWTRGRPQPAPGFQGHETPASGPRETRTLHLKLRFDLGPTPRCKAQQRAAPQISKRRPRVAKPVLDFFFFKHTSCLLRIFFQNGR